jgi:hypothetical protein
MSTDTSPPPNRRLGRTPSPPDDRTLRLAKYAPRKLPPVPSEIRWDKSVKSWPMAGNNRYGDCTFATASHLIQQWTTSKKRPCVITDSAVIQLYLRYSPHDTGYDILTRLTLWRTTGLWADHIYAFAAIDLHDTERLRATIATLGPVDAGVLLPRAWQSDEIWDLGPGPDYRIGSWGSHSVPIVGYDSDFLYCVTWGQVQKLTYGAWHRYFDEDYAIIAPDWIAPDALTPLGYDLAALRADLAEVTKQ